MLFSSILFLTSLASLTVIDAKPTKVQGCDLKHVRLSDLPPGQHNVTVSPHAVPKFVTIGAGVQNYTCQDNVYVSTGAVAELFDISCLAGHYDFNTIQDFAIRHPSGLEIGEKFFRRPIHPIINHYFTSDPVGKGIAPRFDLAGTQRFTTLNKTGSINSPQGKQNVVWLELSEVEGDLAKVVYRTDTVLGQPPASCQNGSSDISVHYAAKYWFFDSVREHWKPEGPSCS